MASKEIAALKKVTAVFDANKASELSAREMNYDATPRVSRYGLCELANFDTSSEKPTMAAFFTMPLYEMNLLEYLCQYEGVQKLVRILDVAHKLVSIFKYVHCSKRTFNDLKAQNIMINTTGRPDADPEVFLIDFGFAAKYVSEAGKGHIPETKQVEAFTGNIVFASERQMNFGATSRKDDLISLFYMLIFLLNDGSLWVGSDPTTDKQTVEQLFPAIHKWKREHDLPMIADLLREKMVIPTSKSIREDQEQHINNFHRYLSLFAREISKIEFSEKPSYTKIKAYLAECKKAC